jgi:UPF0755 protein
MADENDNQPVEPVRSTFGSRSGGRGSKPAIQPDSLPPPLLRSKAARSPLVVFGHGVISLLFLAVLVVGGAAYFGNREFNARGPLGEEKTVVIARGSGTTDIGDTLETAGVIDSSFVFSSMTHFLKTSDQLKAGEYLFKPGISMREVMNTLVEGKGIQHAITIPEGWTSQMIVDRLSQDDVLTGETPPVPREGALLPDTYKFERGTTRAQLIARMESEQKETLAEVWKNRSSALSLKSPAELVTLASIVEKETGKADERPRVASVFLNRLQKNMRLQSDPTVIYGIVGGKGKLDRPISKADLDQQTPFNTYLVGGLPPSPIANPGRAAMEAVANPSRTKELYFVADGTGGHAFAETLDQHNRNVTRWRQAQQSGADQAAAQPGDADPASTATAPASAQPGAPAPASSASAGNGAPMDGEAPATTTEVQKSGKKKRVFNDPVQNTKRDPLLDKTYDLNSPQNVPKVN